MKLRTYMNWTLKGRLCSASLDLSQSAAHQRKMDQLFILIVQQHCELWFPGLNRQQEEKKNQYDH